MLLEVMTYNIHSARDKKGRKSIDRIVGLIGKQGVHVIGLQEVDRITTRAFLIDEIKYLADKLGMYYVYGGNIGIGKGFFGNAILSRYPILNYENYHLPSKGERRGLLVSSIDVHGEAFWFATTHLGLNQKERVEQAKKILSILNGMTGPIILTGDFNETPGSNAYKILKNKLVDISDVLSKEYNSFAENLPTPDVRIDYIMHSKDVVPLYVNAISSDCSDHLPVIAGLKIN